MKSATVSVCRRCTFPGVNIRSVQKCFMLGTPCEANLLPSTDNEMKAFNSNKNAANSGWLTKAKNTS